MKRILLAVVITLIALPAWAADTVKKGATDVTRYIVLVDSATGAPETGYTITDLDLQYTRNRIAPAAKVDAVALAATDTAHTDNQAIQVDPTSSPGLYRIDWPDAAFATGVDKVILVVSGTGLHPAVEEIHLTEPEQMLSPVHWGDYQDLDQVIDLQFSTPGLLTGGTVVIYEDGSADEITTGITLTPNFDSLNSQNSIAIDLSDAGFESGKSYSVFLSAGTTPGFGVRGQMVGTFSVGRYATDTELLATFSPQLPSATAKGNLDDFFDGTGYAGGTIPLNTNVVNQPRTWYVDDDDGAGDTGTREAPFDTYAAAEAAAAPGDTIHILAGTYGAITVTKNWLTIRGDGNDTIVTASSGALITATGIYGLKLENMQIAGTGTATFGLSAIGGRFIECRGLNVTGTQTGGLFIPAAVGVLIEFCTLDTNADAISVADSFGVRIRHCDSLTDASEATSGAAALWTGSGVVHASNSRFRVVKTIASAQLAMAVEFQNGTTSPHGHVLLENCTLEAIATHASNTGRVACIGPKSQAAEFIVYCAMIGGSLKMENAGSGDGHQIDASVANSDVRLHAVNADPTEFAGPENIHYLDKELADVLVDTADMQPKFGTFPDLGSGTTLASNLEDMRDNGTAAFDRSTDSLQAIRDRGDAEWTGGGGTADWTADERTAMRSILGIPGSGTTPADPTVGILDTIRDFLADADSFTDVMDAQGYTSIRAAKLDSLVVHSGTAQAGAANTITLDTGASTTANQYWKQFIFLNGGTGAGQVREIANYNGTTRVARVFEPWSVVPDNTTTFIVLPLRK